MLLHMMQVQEKAYALTKTKLTYLFDEIDILSTISDNLKVLCPNDQSNDYDDLDMLLDEAAIVSSPNRHSNMEVNKQFLMHDDDDDDGDGDGDDDVVENKDQPDEEVYTEMVKRHLLKYQKHMHQLRGELDVYCSAIPTLSYNGSRYDIGLCKSILIKKLKELGGKMHFVCKTHNTYKSISTDRFFLFLDMCNYMMLLKTKINLMRKYIQKW